MTPSKLVSGYEDVMELLAVCVLISLFNFVHLTPLIVLEGKCTFKLCGFLLIAKLIAIFLKSGLHIVYAACT